MSLLFTESFGAFVRRSGTAAELVTNEVIAEMQASFARAGMTYLAHATWGCAVVTADPVNPERSAFTFVPKQMGNIYSKVGWPIPYQGKPIVFGFSLFIPSAWPDLARTAAYCLQAGTGPMHTTTNASGLSGELFNIGHDLRIRRGSATPISQRQCVRGGMSYIECRYDGSTVRVWLDDALVLEETAVLMEGGMTLSYAPNGATGLSLGDHLRWSVANVYCLSEDEHAPNVRLGPTTRVIARRPAGDIDVQFMRPDNATSNAQVVAQDITSTLPAMSLQTESVGARDEYALPVSPEISSALMVHGMMTKVVASNLESAPHMIRPWVKSGTQEGADDFAWEFVQKVCPDISVPLQSATVREDGTIFLCGTGPCIYTSQDGGDTWRLRYNGATAVIANDITVGPDGTVMACCSNGTILSNLPTDSLDTWTSVASGTVTNLTAIAVSPSGVWVASSLTAAGNVVKLGAAAWKLQARNAAQWIGWVDNKFLSLSGPNLWQSPTGNDGSWIQNSFTATISNGITAGILPVGGRNIIPGTTTSNVSTMLVTVLGTIPANNAGIATTTETREVFRTTFGQVQGPCRGYVTAPDGLVLISASAGALYFTRDGYQFTTVLPPGIATSDGLGKPAYGNGQFIVPVLAGSRVLLLRKRATKRALLNADGYAMHTNVVTLDPATGLPWTPTAAAVASVGFTLDN